MIKKVTFLLALAIVVNVFFLVFCWVHRLFVVELNPFAGSVVMLVTLAAAIPLAVFAVRRLVRYFGARGWMDPAAVFILGGFVFLLWDLVNWPVFYRTTLDIQVHDTLFVIAHTHITIGPIAIMLFFATVYAGYPRVTGRIMNAPMGYLHVAMTFVALFAINWPVHYIGLAGMPRRYMDYGDWIAFNQFEGFDVLGTWLAILLVCGQLLFFVNLVYSAIRGRKIGPEGTR